MSYLLLVVTALLEVESVTRTGLAEQPSDDGRRFFDIGVQAYSQGQFSPAIAAFREAYRLTKRPGLLFSLAQAYRRAYESAGRAEDLTAAIKHYVSYLATQPSDERKRQAQQYLQQLKARAGQMNLEDLDAAEPLRTELVIAATVPEAQLRLDGTPLGRLPHAAAVTPGHHSIEIAAEGYALFVREVEIRAGEVVALNAQLEHSGATLFITGNAGAGAFVDGRSVGSLPLGPLSLSAGPHTVEVRQPGHYSLRQEIDVPGTGSERLHLAAPPTIERILAWALIGGGATGLAAGGVLGLVALHDDREAQRLERDEPNNYVQFNQTVSARNDFRLAAGLAAGVGAASVLAGGILMFSAGPAPIHKVSSSSWAPSLSLGVRALQLGVHGSF